MCKYGIATFIFLFLWKFSALAEEGAPSTHCEKVAVKARITDQNCSKHVDEIQTCTTTFKIVDEWKEVSCHLVGLEIKEQGHFKHGYPDAQAGGFRFDGNIGETWEIAVCRDKKTERWSWCYTVPSAKYGKLVE
jgi:hypothetical protein